MNRDELLHTLETLHQDLSSRTELDDTTRSALAVVKGDLERLITKAGPSPEADESEEPIGERIRAALAEMEIRHPTLTGALSKFADRLSDMGI
jgi:hypothetical protein